MKQAVEDLKNLYGEELDSDEAPMGDSDSNDGMAELEKESKAFQGTRNPNDAIKVIPVYDPSKIKAPAPKS